MTNEEIIAHQQLMKTFHETEIGAAFRAFDSAHSAAWIADTEYGAFDSGQAERKADKAWAKEKEARKALMAILLPLAGIEQSS